MTQSDVHDPECYFNRELSWLEFNDRVLREGLKPELPLLERVKFLAIVSANLDEFFMIRVGGLMQQRAAGLRKRDIAGMTPAQQLRAISKRTHLMVLEQTEGIAQVLAELADEGIRVLRTDDLDDDTRQFVRDYFLGELMPVLTPLALDQLDPPPLLAGMQLQVALLLESANPNQPDPRVAIVPVPSQFPRFVPVRDDAADDAHEPANLRLIPLEDIIAAEAETLFPGCRVLDRAFFRITRDADVAIQDDDASDLLNAVEQAVLDRRRRAAVRLSISDRTDRRLKRWLIDWLDIRREDVYEIDGLLDATGLFQIASLRGFESLKIPDWPPLPPADLIDADNLWQTLQERDVLLFHPYESFDAVVRLVEEAAADPDVLAIKQTLYRTSGDSPIVKALALAAQNGKEVTALVELKARFDEARNVLWARQLEDAGCHVLYGIAGYKTHAKALLIVRREPPRIRRYVHLATGNYNDKTAKIYSDVGMMTANPKIASDVAAFFNLLTGHSEAVGWSMLTVEPMRLKERFIELIEREINASTSDRPGLIMAKVNSLQDRDISAALYRASRAGVEVKLNIRGLCCLRPGVPDLSENIEVRSIIDRYLEHARIFYFRNGGHEEVYMSSADWMRRNLEKRIEIIFPVPDPSLRRRLIDIMHIYFTDNTQARRLLPTGTYEPLPQDAQPLRAQEHFHDQALEATRAASQQTVRYRPLSRPKE